MPHADAAHPGARSRRPHHLGGVGKAMDRARQCAADTGDTNESGRAVHALRVASRGQQQSSITQRSRAGTSITTPPEVAACIRRAAGRVATRMSTRNCWTHSMPPPLNSPRPSTRFSGTSSTSDGTRWPDLMQWCQRPKRAGDGSETGQARPCRCPTRSGSGGAGRDGATPRITGGRERRGRAARNNRRSAPAHAPHSPETDTVHGGTSRPRRRQ